MRTAAPFAAISALAAAPAAEAHHALSMYDMRRSVRVDGVVAEVRWTNPHVLMAVDAPAGSGETVRWEIELSSPSSLTRRGWTESTIEPGAAVSFAVHPLRDGRPGGAFYEATLPNGEVIMSPRAQAERRAQAQAAARELRTADRAERRFGPARAHTRKAP